MRYAVILFGAAVLVSCGNSNTGPSLDLTGTFIGGYTASPDPGAVYEGVLQLTQQSSKVTGTLTTNAGRTANVSGTLSGERVNLSMTFTDSCYGSASATTEVLNGGDRLVGNYQANDCLGTYSGGFDLDRQ